MENIQVCCGKLVETDSMDAIFGINDIIGVKTAHLAFSPKYVIADVFLCNSCGEFYYKIDPDKSYEGFPKGLILPEDRFVFIKSLEVPDINVERTCSRIDRLPELVMS